MLLQSQDILLKRLLNVTYLLTYLSQLAYATMYSTDDVYCVDVLCTYDDVKVFSGCDATTAEVPADGRCRTNSASDLAHKQVGLVDDRCRQRHRTRKPVLAVVTHLVRVQSPRVVCSQRTAINVNSANAEVVSSPRLRGLGSHSKL